MEVKNIHEAINAVMNEVGYVKKQRSTGVNYSFAGEAALIAALRPAMVENGIYMHVLEVKDIRRENTTTKSGAAMINTLISAVIRFTHAPSGTYIDCAATGEGFDSGDKSANKAMTGSYKYAMRQTFCIETGDDPDKFPSPDKTEHTPTDAERKAKAMNAFDELKKRAAKVGVTIKEPAANLTPEQMLTHYREQVIPVKSAEAIIAGATKEQK